MTVEIAAIGFSIALARSKKEYFIMFVNSKPERKRGAFLLTFCHFRRFRYTNKVNEITKVFKMLDIFRTVRTEYRLVMWKNFYFQT